MEMVLNIGVRFLAYIVVGLPLVRGIFSGLGNVAATIIAVIIVAIAASILEARGLMKKLVAFVSRLLGVTLKSSGNAIGTSIGSAIAPDESYAECMNCGSQVKLINGAGVCPGCDTPVSAGR